MLQPSLWEALNQGQLLATFVLTTVAGGLLTFVFQWMSWRRQAMIDLHRQRYTEGTKLLKDLCGLIDRRFYALQRLTWAVSDNPDDPSVKEREKEYFQTVIEWNQNLRSMHNLIRLLVGDEQATAFLDYADDYRMQDPQSLHYRFVAAHRAVLKARQDRELIAPAEELVRRVNHALSNFLYDITTLFTQRAETLALLKIPGQVSAEAKSRQIFDVRLPPSHRPTEELEAAEMRG
jgi:hypothetical protein